MVAIARLPLLMGSSSDGTSLMVTLLAVLLVAYLSGRLASRLGYPSILGELVAGIIFGPPLLNWLSLGPNEELRVLAQVGVFLMMLYVGMEIDPRELRKSSFSAAMAALGGLLIPGLLAFLTVRYMADGGELRVSGAVVAGIVVGATSLAVQSRILFDLQLLDLRIAHVLMAAALIADATALILFSALKAVVEMSESGGIAWDGLAVVFLKALLFLTLTVVVGLKLFPWVGRRVAAAGYGGRTVLFTMVLMVGLLFAEAAEVAGLDIVLGAFLAGLFLREGIMDRKLSKDVTHLVHDLSIGFLAPIFFVTVGFSVDLSVLWTRLPLLLAVIAVATVGKIVGTAIFYQFTGYGWREGLTVGAGMNGHGAVEAVIAGIALRSGLLGVDATGAPSAFARELFSILIIMAIVTTLTVPCLLKLGAAWLRRRGELVASGSARTGLVIVGAGPLARLLGRQFAADRRVTLIDNNSGHCDAAEAAGLQAVHGNALNEEVMAEAGAARARYLLALTPNLEVNVLAGTMAQDTFLVPNIHVLVTDPYSPALETDCVSATVDPLFGGPVDPRDWESSIAHGEFELEDVRVTQETDGASYFGTLGNRQPELPLICTRDGSPGVLHSQTTLRPGDSVRLLRRPVPASQKADPFAEMLRECPVVDERAELGLADLFQRVGRLLSPELGVPVDDVVERLLEREAESSAVLTAGLAVPHLRIEGQGVFHLVVMRSQIGVRFVADEPPVHAIFVLASSRDERNRHLRALSAIARIAQSGAFQANWMAVPEMKLRNVLQQAHGVPGVPAGLAPLRT